MIVQLDMDALELWLAALRNATTSRSPTGSGPSMMDLAPQMLHLLAENLDLLGTVVSILEAYLLLDAEGILQVCCVFPFTIVLLHLAQDVQPKVEYVTSQSFEHFRLSASDEDGHRHRCQLAVSRLAHVVKLIQNNRYPSVSVQGRENKMRYT